jgi:hypothetical protein
VNDFLRNLNAVLKYGKSIDPHPHFDRNGYSPDLHALLTTVAAADEDKYPTSVENASVILGSGTTTLFPSLGKALAAEGHPLAGALNWKTVEKGLALDHALHTTFVTHSGYGLNAKVATFDSLHPSKQRSLLTGYGHVIGRDEYSDAARQRLTEEMKRKVPDAKDIDIRKALERAEYRAGVLAEDRRRESAHTGYRIELERHNRDPAGWNHPDETRYWGRMGFEGPPEPIKINPETLLLLKAKHARRY